MQMAFKRNDNKLGFCQWFSNEGQGGMCPVALIRISIHPTHSLNTIKEVITGENMNLGMVNVMLNKETDTTSLLRQYPPIFYQVNIITRNTVSHLDISNKYSCISHACGHALCIYVPIFNFYSFLLKCHTSRNVIGKSHRHNHGIIW